MCRYYVIVIVLFVNFWFSISIAQVDSTKRAWFRDYYLNYYLTRVLEKKEYNYIPTEGVIPDSITAVEIAIIILSRVYGKDVIERERPFTAVERNGYWVVYGSLPRDSFWGGVAEIVVRKKNGEIINISHGK
ncbi:MAG TPA: NTF2 fold immunity protein [Bacteroidota bacterium]|nr:NTF2 fold immunity protein [Bacteroidota bacterium]